MRELVVVGRASARSEASQQVKRREAEDVWLPHFGKDVARHSKTALFSEGVISHSMSHSQHRRGRPAAHATDLSIVCA